MPPKKVVRPAQENISLGPQYVVPSSPSTVAPRANVFPRVREGELVFGGMAL